MSKAFEQMLAPYNCQTRDDHLSALREILQQIALLGLWRSKFFEHAAFYGGTALRILYQLNRYSEDLDFSLLRSDKQFSFETYRSALEREINSFGFEITFEAHEPKPPSAIASAFLKPNSLKQLITIRPGSDLLRQIHPDEVLKIKLEVDTDPPRGFATETRVILLPVPFAVRIYCLPDLFAGKLHAVLCRKWKNRVKGRDWFDLVWYVSRRTPVNLSHLESRLRYSGDWPETPPLTRSDLIELLRSAARKLNVRQACQEVDRFVRDKTWLELWSQDFFLGVIDQIQTT
ncbi:MAG: nucleotidyl transferase AbiEii/AbiGii toxin family protein [Candidatus Riflebacteria bacterium]|nr:nucleotidyl transferase AbiEii/AbiGii toxin family protein [Candidatus Riflebacteria bacterium]